MPTVEKTSGGTVYFRTFDRAIEPGDQVDVDDEMADYLVAERGDFTVVADGEGDGNDGGDDGVEDGEQYTSSVTDIEAAIEDGTCPWCDDYEGDAVGQHAASAHPDEWDAYKED